MPLSQEESVPVPRGECPHPRMRVSLSQEERTGSLSQEKSVPIPRGGERVPIPRGEEIA